MDIMEEKESSNADWWGRALGLASLGVAIWGVCNSNKGAPDYYAAPHALSYCYTESNLLDHSETKAVQGTLTIKITNNGSTPARNVRAIVTPISDSPEITADQKYEIQDGPFGTKVVEIDRVPPGETAMIDILEKVDKFPNSFGSGYGRWKSKYQYFPVVEEVQTEFGRLQCDYGYYRRYCLRLADDGGGPDNFTGNKAKEEARRRSKSKN